MVAALGTAGRGAGVGRPGAVCHRVSVSPMGLRVYGHVDKNSLADSPAVH